MNIDALMGLVNAQINDTARRNGVMTLGQLRDALKNFSPDALVNIDTGANPGELDSYRGYYERLAFAPTQEPVTVDSVLRRLDRADGNTYHGYKGGEYDMDAHTFIHVAPWGDCGPCVVGVRDDHGRAVIVTAEEESGES